jgi:hypothetical protein
VSIKEFRGASHLPNLIYKVTYGVRPSDVTFWEHFLWRNRPQRFFVAEPAIETMTTGYQRPRSWEPNATTFLYNCPRPQNGQNY